MLKLAAFGIEGDFDVLLDMAIFLPDNTEMHSQKRGIPNGGVIDVGLSSSQPAQPQDGAASIRA